MRSRESAQISPRHAIDAPCRPRRRRPSLAGVAKIAADPKAKKKAAKSVAAKLKKKAKAASSTKELTDEGAKVVTVAEGADATASAAGRARRARARADARTYGPAAPYLIHQQILWNTRAPSGPTTAPTRSPIRHRCHLLALQDGLSVPQRCGKVALNRRGVRHLVHLQG